MTDTAVEMDSNRQTSSRRIPKFLQRTQSCGDKTRKLFKKYWMKLLAFLVLGVLALVYSFHQDLAGIQFKGILVSEFIAFLFVSWAFYEALTTIQSSILWVLKKVVTTGYWYVYFFTSAFEYQTPWFFWAIIEVIYIQNVSSVQWSDEEMDYILIVRDTVLSICIGYSIRNLVLKWLFWVVHQKKLSDKMKKFLELDSVLTNLFETFVVKNQSFDQHKIDTPNAKSSDENKVEEQYAIEEDDVATFDYTVNAGAALAIEALRQMQEFEESQKEVFTASSKVLQLNSQEDAIEAAKALFERLDTKQRGSISWRRLDKFLPLKQSIALLAELNPMFQKSILDQDDELEAKQESKAQESVRVSESDASSVSSDTRLTSLYDPDARAGDEVLEDDIDFGDHKVTEGMLIKVFLKLYTIGNSLSQVSSAWEELSSGLRTVVDVVLWMCIGLTVLIVSNAKWYKIVGIISTLLVSSSFAIGDALSRVIISLSFIFLSKPYEVGDGVSFNQQEPPLFYVEKINVFSTTFRTVHNRRFTYPNWLLSEIAVYNLSRNKVSKHDLFFELAFHTPASKLKKLRKEIGNFLKKNSESFTSDFWFVISNFTVNNYLQLQVRIGLKNTFDQSLINATRRSEFLLFFRDVCQQHDVSYKLLVKPIEISTDAEIVTSMDLIKSKAL